MIELLLATAAAVVVLGVWRYSILRRPWKKCMWCDGAKSNRSTWLFPSTFGRCWWCGGTGQRRRFGALVMKITKDGSRRR